MPLPRRTSLALTTILLAGLLAGCTGGIHRAGEHQLSLLGGFGHAIKGDSIYPQGEGQADNFGVTVGYQYFIRDRIGLTAQLSPYRKYSQPDGDAHAVELEAGLRWYFWEPRIAETPLAFYIEALGGLMHGSRRIPAEGAHTNFTQSTGLGLEIPLADQISWTTGYRYRHLSHGHVWAGEPNPGQNDHYVYTGIAISLN